MNDKFVPIGTVCTIRGNNKMVMVIGYLYNNYKSKFITNDYIAVPFPEGTMLLGRFVTFNAKDILNIEFMGYKTKEYYELNNSLNKSLNDDNDDFIVINEVFENDKLPSQDYIFDKDGLVVGGRDIMIDNPFRSKEILDSKKENKSNWSSVFEDIQFDENGVVISTIEKNKSNESNSSKYKFDENGVVIDQDKEES